MLSPPHLNSRYISWLKREGEGPVNALWYWRPGHAPEDRQREALHPTVLPGPSTAPGTQLLLSDHVLNG